MMTVLGGLADRLDALGHPWALGGSWVLYRLGIHGRPRDIDIVLTCPDVKACTSAVVEWGFDRSKPEHGGFCTDVALEGAFGTVEADLLVNFGVLKDGVPIRYPLEWDRPFGMLDIGGREVPVCSPEGWYAFYWLMGDPKGRTPVLERYFRENGCDGPLLERYCRLAGMAVPPVGASWAGKND